MNTKTDIYINHPYLYCVSYYYSSVLPYVSLKCLKTNREIYETTLLNAQKWTKI